VLDAIVGTNDGFDITLNGTDGKKVAVLVPGTYTIVVHDRSAMHNFHLASNTDRTVDFRTELEFVGDMSFTVTFKDNTRYAYACEPHWQTMNGAFWVSSTPPPTTKPALRTVSASIRADGSAHLGASSLAAGSYRLVVTDSSRQHNFHLVGPGVNRRTGIASTGIARWDLTLRAGAYRYGSDPGLLRGSLRVR